MDHTSSYVHFSNTLLQSLTVINPLSQYRELGPLLEAFHSRSDVDFHYPSRVLWTSSLEAVHFYRPEDWQLVETSHPYESSKYQIDLVASQLEKQALQMEEQTNRPAKVRHVMVHPGCASTGIVGDMVPPILLPLMTYSFYIVRPSLHGHYHNAGSRLRFYFSSPVSWVHPTTQSLLTQPESQLPTPS